MNMIVNTSDLVGCEAETQKTAYNKKALAKLLEAWESKQANRAKKVGGFGLLAVSLAACNTSSDDATTSTSTTTTTTTTTTATPAAQTFILTTAPQALVGGDGADTFYGLSGATTEAATDTLGAADTVDGGAGTDTFFVTNTANNTGALGESMVSNVEIFNVRQATAGQTSTFDASLVAGETEVNAYLSTGTTTITNLASGAAAGMVGNENVTNGAFNAGWAATVTSATANITGGTTAGAIVFSGAALTSMTINSTGAKNTVGTIELPATTTSLTIDAATNLTTGAVDNNTAAALTTLTIKGAGAVNLSATALEATVKTITASDNSGGVTLTMPTLVTASFTGGSGADTITSNSVLTTGSVNGGDGTDILVLGGATHANTAALGAKYTNFETLRIGNFSQDVSLISGITSLQIGSMAGGDTVSKITPAQAAAGITLIADNAATTLAMTTADAAGSGDAIKIILGTGLTNSEATDFTGALTISGFESATFEQNAGPLATTDALKTSTMTAITATTLTSTTLKGHAYTITDASTTLANAIDGSALTGVLTIGGNLIAGSSVTGGAGADVMTAGTNNGVAYTGNAGNDTFKATVAQLVSTGSNDHSFAGGAGTDVLNVTGAGAATLTDNHFMGITGIETLTIDSTAAVSVTSGGAFNTAVDGAVTITDGATAATNTIVYALGLATDDITITSTGGSQTGAATEDVTITTGSGNDTVSYGATGHVGVAGGGGQAVITISTNAGNDSITVTTGTILAGTADQTAVIDPGSGQDSVTLTHTTSTTDTSVMHITMSSGESSVTAHDTITGFLEADGTNRSDGILLTGTAAVGTLGTSTDFGTIKSHSITTGIATFDDAGVFATALNITSTNLADVVGYLAANTATNDAVAFKYDNDSDGTADGTMLYHNTTSDVLVLLAGTTDGTSLITTNAVTDNAIFIT